MGLQSITITIELPEEEIRRAKAAGVLAPESLARLIRDELERRADVDRMREIMDALQSLPGRPTPEEIDAEIQTYRAEKRAKRASRD